MKTLQEPPAGKHLWIKPAFMKFTESIRPKCSLHFLSWKQEHVWSLGKLLDSAWRAEQLETQNFLSAGVHRGDHVAEWDPSRGENSNTKTVLQIHSPYIYTKSQCLWSLYESFAFVAFSEQKQRKAAITGQRNNEQSKAILHKAIVRYDLCYFAYVEALTFWRFKSTIPKLITIRILSCTDSKLTWLRILSNRHHLELFKTESIHVNEFCPVVYIMH
jgi:hypothetical protein